MAIDLQPGARIKRTKLHAEYGGRRQGGISPSRQSDNVFAITAPSGEHYGYIYDGRGKDGFFHYTGEGQIGDQQMTQGNRAIRDHEIEGRDLHLFEAQGTELEYIGRFRYHDDYAADAPGIGTAEVRKVIVLRLAQIDGTDAGPRRNRLDRLGTERIKELAVQQHLTERMIIEGGREPYEAERREQRLVQAFVDHLEERGHELCQLQLHPDGEAAPIICDLYDKTTRAVYEAKGTVARPAVRMAIGQLADYARFVEPEPARALLVPQRPRDDLVELATRQGITIVWRDDSGFAATDLKKALLELVG